MKDQEYYDYSSDYGKDPVKEEPDKEAVETSEHPQEKPQQPKKKGCYGCTIMIIGIIMIVGGIITIIIARSGAPEKVIPLKQGERIVIIQDVNPDNKYGISLKVSLAGNNYYTYKETEHYTSRGSSYTRTVTKKSLVHRVPYTVKATRESNGEVVYDLYDEFELGNDEVVKKQNEVLRNSPSFSRDITTFDFTDKVRFEFLVKDDEKYKTQVESGEVAVYKMSSTRSVTWQIALLITVLGFLGFFIGFIAAIIQFFFLAAKGSRNQIKT
jgi:hypothetical protein